MRRVTDASSDLTVVAWSDGGRRPAQRRSVARRMTRGLAAMLALTGLAAGAAVPAWLWQAGRLQPLAEDLRARAVALTADQGMTISDVVLIGRSLAPRDAIGAALAARPGAPILAFNPADARDRLQAVPWVRRATVSRRLPGTVVVWLEEYTPFAVWQHDGRFALVDRDGAVILDAERDGATAIAGFASLPQIVGDGAPAAAAALLDRLIHYPELAVRLRAAVRVGGRRWDLTFDPDIRVLLPERDWNAALSRLDALHAERRLLDRTVAAIDMRLPDRLVLRPAGKDGEDKPA